MSVQTAAPSVTREQPLASPRCGIYLLWLPLGARGHVARLSGLGFEGVVARLERRRPLDLYHSVYTDIPFKPGTDLTPSGVAEQVRGMRMAIAVNALGLPAAAVPVGIGGGLPQLVQVIGPRDREDLCLEAAAALEDRLGTIAPIDPR